METIHHILAFVAVMIVVNIAVHAFVMYDMHKMNKEKQNER